MRLTRTPLWQAIATAHLLLAATSASALEFDLPAQPLDAALTDFAEQANVRLLYDASLTPVNARRRRSRATTRWTKACSGCCRAAG
ncbi:hypothetical protein [Pseudomonas sp. OHS18]|uniref:hypothetical protein n=1 Tax=Pseudomonas sp. OHS18 TaxID=3399679 RepID=UPI003A8633F1